MRNIAQEQFGIDVKSIELISSGVVNRNFLVTDRNGEQYILKQYENKSAYEITYELAILRRLEEVDFPSPRPMRHIAEHDGKPIICYRLIEGQTCTNETFSVLFDIGRLMATMHLALEETDLPYEKGTWDERDLGKLVRTEAEEFTMRVGAGAEEVLEFVQAELQPNAPAGLPITVTHQDIKSENILVNDGEQIVGIIDFDNAYRGERIHDLTTTMIWLCFDSAKSLNIEKLKCLLEGYESVQPLVSAEKEYLPEALAFRLVREVFISPYVATSQYALTLERAKYFRECYRRYGTYHVDVVRKIISEL